MRKRVAGGARITPLGLLRMKPQLVVFDVAGTTVRDDDSVNHCLRQALAHAKWDASREEINEVMGLPKPEAIRLVLERKSGRPADPAHVLAIHSDFVQRMVSFYQDEPGAQSLPGVRETFEALRRAGIKVALDTGFSRNILRAILGRLSWGDTILDASVASDEVARGRPHPDLIFKAMELTRVTDPARVAKVGDTPADLLEGTAARCGWVVGITWGSHTRQQLAAHPHTHLIASITELLDVFPQ